MSDDLNIDIPEINFPDTIELDDDIDFSVADFSLVDEEEQTRIIKPKMAKSAIYNKAAAEAAKAAAEAKNRISFGASAPGSWKWSKSWEGAGEHDGKERQHEQCDYAGTRKNSGS